MASFWDTTGGLWLRGGLIGKVGAAFASTGSQHGGQETTLLSIIHNLFHHGLTIVGLDYGFQEQLGVEEVKGGSPYGATTIADSQGQRQPSRIDLNGARYLGRKVAQVLMAGLFGDRLRDVPRAEDDDPPIADIVRLE